MANMLTLTILDFPEILELFYEALDAVPDWERAALTERLEAILVRANAQRNRKPSL